MNRQDAKSAKEICDFRFVIGCASSSSSSSSIPGTAGTADPAGTTGTAAGRGKRLLDREPVDEQTLVPPSQTPGTAAYTPLRPPRVAHYVCKRFECADPAALSFPPLAAADTRGGDAASTTAMPHYRHVHSGHSSASAHRPAAPDDHRQYWQCRQCRQCRAAVRIGPPRPSPLILHSSIIRLGRMINERDRHKPRHRRLGDSAIFV